MVVTMGMTACGTPENTDNTEMLGEQDPVSDLHIQETGMVHKNQAGLFFEFFQTFYLVFKFGAGHAENGEDSNEDTPKNVGFFGAFVLIAGDGGDLVIVHMLDTCLQCGTSFLFTNCSYYKGNA